MLRSVLLVCVSVALTLPRYCPPQVLVVGNGQAAEFDTPQHLLDEGGIFSDMVLECGQERARQLRLRARGAPRHRSVDSIRDSLRRQSLFWPLDDQ